MKDPEKLVDLANKVTAATECFDDLETLLVSSGALSACGWTINPRGRTLNEAREWVMDAARDEWREHRGGEIPRRGLDLFMCGFEGVLAVVPFLAEFPEGE